MLRGKFVHYIIRAAACLLMVATSASVFAQASAKSFVVVDAQSGHILLRSNEDAKLPVASLTKVATAMVVLDWADVSKQNLAERVVLPFSIERIGGANPVGLQPGDTVSLRDLLYAALMQSDNRAAYTLSLFVGSRLADTTEAASAEIAFIKQMNALARSLEMKRTGFVNAHGLDQEKGGLSTAEDMARLAQYALGHRGFLFYGSQPNRQITIERAGQPMVLSLTNTNELLGTRMIGSVETKIDGLKTGMTAKAGACVIITTERPPLAKKIGATTEVTPRRLIVVVLGSNDRFGIATNLLAQGWNAYEAWAQQGRPIKKSQSL